MSKIPEELKPFYLDRSEFVETKYYCKVPATTDPSLVATPEYWQHQAEKLHKYDRIRVVADDFSWELQIDVLDVDRTAGEPRLHLAVTPSYPYDLPINPPAPEPMAYEASYAAGDGWRAVALADRRVVLKGLRTEAEVHRAMERRHAALPGVEVRSYSDEQCARFREFHAMIDRAQAQWAAPRSAR